MVSGSREKDRFKVGTQGAVGVSDLELVFEITHGPQPTQDQVHVLLPCALNREAVETDHLHTAEMVRGDANLIQPSFQRKGGGLTGILENSHNHLPEESTSTLDQVEVTEGEGVETAGIESPHRLKTADLDPMQLRLTRFS